METSSSSSPANPSRPAVFPVLVPPVITGVAIALLIGVARIYEQLPLQAPACGLRTTTGIPCLACGGTRSLMALAHGRVSEALAFNPLIFFGVVAAAAWLSISLIRVAFFSARPITAARPLPVWAIVTGLTTLFVANWVYLILYLPE